jgi:hypothetical protein
MFTITNRVLLQCPMLRLIAMIFLLQVVPDQKSFLWVESPLDKWSWIKTGLFLLLIASCLGVGKL